MADPTEPHQVTLEPQDCAVVRQTLPMSELKEFFARAFGLTMASAAKQGRQVVGPPFALYFGIPTDTVDVAGGFPVDASIDNDDAVVPYRLPGGPAVQLLHVGSYGSLGQAYERMVGWMRERNLRPADYMWESYLNEPPHDQPELAQTMIVWPIA